MAIKKPFSRLRYEAIIKLSKASACRLLNQLGLRPQKPLWRAFQKDPELVEKWVKEEYPQLLALARKHKADIFFGDEAGMRSDFHSGKTSAARGKTPVISTIGARFGCNMISAIFPPRYHAIHACRR